jgi:hypothetical protein
LKTIALKNGMSNVEVKANIRVKYNGRSAQYFIDPDMDISTASYSFNRKAEGVFPIVK